MEADPDIVLEPTLPDADLNENEDDKRTSKRENSCCCSNKNKPSKKKSADSETAEPSLNLSGDWDRDREGNPLFSSESMRRRKRKEEISDFVCKTLVVKATQFLISASYAFFMYSLQNAFRRASILWTIIPGVCLIFISLFVRVRKHPPHFSVSLIYLLVWSFSLSFITGTTFYRFDLYSICLPVSIIFVNVAYLFMLSIYYWGCMTVETSSKRYFMTPLWTVWLLNLLFIGGTIYLTFRLLPEFDTVHKIEMISIFCIPTIFLSTLITWFSMLQLRQIIAGKWFYVVYEPGFQDYLYAALYLI